MPLACAVYDVAVVDVAAVGPHSLGRTSILLWPRATISWMQSSPVARRILGRSRGLLVWFMDNERLNLCSEDFLKSPISMSDSPVSGTVSLLG
jgi:hypothetical protein